MPLLKNSDHSPGNLVHCTCLPTVLFRSDGVVLLVLFVFFALAQVATAAPEPFLAPGSHAPTTNIEDLTGTKHNVPATGSWSIVFFWSLFCHTCLDEIPHLIEETAHLASPSCTPFFISLDGSRMRKGLQNFQKKRRLEATLLVDEVASAAYLTADKWGVRTTPSVFLVDPGGVIRYSREGPFDLQEILALMKGPTPASSNLSLSLPSSASDTQETLPASTSLSAPASASEKVLSPSEPARGP
ncbi:MAG TPA: TlpA disulfide reductase family protein [Candidatus Ozemobacteraceae bacterium]|nr:TlpA disulfide reductase family protein [Candidatus Ozemobacteraceae bacterium]